MDAGFSLVEVLMAMFVLLVGLLSLMMLIDVGNRTTATNRARQSATSLARDVIENARNLPYGQLTQSGVAAVLQPLIVGSTVSNGSNLTVTRQPYTFTVTFTVCSMDDPADGLGNHDGAPASGGVWCSDVAAEGGADSQPDDYKRFSVTVTPAAPYSSHPVQETTLIPSSGINGPSVTCLSTSGTCPGTDQLITTGASPQNPSATPAGITFNVTTSSQASSVQWYVNGHAPASNELSSGANDPYFPSGTTSSFVWNTAAVPDGTYQISAVAYDANGHNGTTATLQIKLNRQMATPPSWVNAGYNGFIKGADVQWVPSVDGDVLYYRVFSQVGTNAPTQVCQTSALSCSDLTAPAPAGPPACNNPPQSYTTSNLYWVVGVDTDPTTGLPRQSTVLSTKVDANLCDHPPKKAGTLSLTSGSGSITLSWALPGSPVDPDTGDSIDGWWIYRWPKGGAFAAPGTRYAFIGSTDASGNWVTSYVDQSPDPGGTQQNYCVTGVDRILQESGGCSNTVTG